MPSPDDPADWEVLGRVTAADKYGAYTALRTGTLMLLPAGRSRTGMRALKFSAVDPVSLALQEGRRVCAFPNVPGWSVQATARRAVLEHLAWLRTAPSTQDAGTTLARLLSAARAALLLESVRESDPELSLTATETARRLGGRSAQLRTVADDALGHYQEFAVRRVPPPAATLAAMRTVVAELPAYAGGLDALGYLRRPLAVEE